MQSNFDLDKPVLSFSQSGIKATWTIRDAVEGIQIFGGIGSGKTSGSGKSLALKYLSLGFGGLVLTAKIDEKQAWIDYCQRTNRLNDLIILESGGNHCFDFIDYESTQKTGGFNFTENIVQVIKTVIKSSEEKSGNKGDDPFWESALDMLMFNVIDLCKLAYGRATIKDMFEIAMSASKPPDDEKKDGADAFKTATTIAIAKINSLVQNYLLSLPVELVAKLEQDERLLDNHLKEHLPEAHLFRLVERFFSDTYKNLADKTKSVILFSFSGFLFRFLRDPIRSLFCSGNSTFKPEDSLNGKIILLNLPVKEYHKVGRDSQVMFKYIWQRAMEKRDIRKNDRPVFLWADEAQHFLHEYDAEYQATARSSRIATVYLSQNIPNYHANMGGQRSEYRVKSFLGTLGTKLFHANVDVDTNKYASELIGQGYVHDETHSSTTGQGFSVGRSSKMILESMVRPESFAKLKKGGNSNSSYVEAIIHQQRAPFSNGMNHLKITFDQNK